MSCHVETLFPSASRTSSKGLQGREGIHATLSFKGAEQAAVGVIMVVSPILGIKQWVESNRAPLSPSLLLLFPTTHRKRSGLVLG